MEENTKTQITESDARPLAESVVKEKKQSNQKTKNMAVLVAVLIVGLGVVTGYFLSGLSKGKSKTTGSDVSSSGQVAKGKEYGLVDVKGRDTAMGVIETGGLDGEGTHKLLREGGPSQTVYLTSSVVDLDMFKGKKVQIWGETFKGQKAGWFMDVLKIKPLD